MFLTKEQRAAEALRKRQEESEQVKKKQEEERKKRIEFLHQADGGSHSHRDDRYVLYFPENPPSPIFFKPKS